MNILTTNNKFALWNNKALQFVASEPTPPVDPYNPLGLPANTVRVRTNDGEPPISHRQAFYNCGSNTQTGAAELAQIPSGWK